MDELIMNQDKFQTDLIELINKSGLPAFILEPILKDVYQQVIAQKQQQKELAKKNIEERSKKEKKEEK